MSIEVSPEVESRLAEEAAKRGISIDSLLEELIEANVTGKPIKSAPVLPVWRLGDVGALHRRDIYDDVD